MKPLGDLVLIKPDVAKTSSSSGLFLGDQKKPLAGTVVAISDGTEDYRMALKVGDYVSYHNNSGVPTPFNGDECLMMSERKCIAIL